MDEELKIQPGPNSVECPLLRAGTPTPSPHLATPLSVDSGLRSLLIPTFPFRSLLYVANLRSLFQDPYQSDCIHIFT
jgi:hypothetical protein